MTKLILRESCFTGVKNVVIQEIKKTSIHKVLTRETNEQIKENRLKYAAAYHNAKSYYNI